MFYQPKHLDLLPPKHGRKKTHSKSVDLDELCNDNRYSNIRKVRNIPKSVSYNSKLSTGGNTRNILQSGALSICPSRSPTGGCSSFAHGLDKDFIDTREAFDSSFHADTSGSEDRSSDSATSSTSHVKYTTAIVAEHGRSEIKKSCKFSASKSFGYLFKRQLSLPNYTPSAYPTAKYSTATSKIPIPIPISVKKSKSVESNVGKLQSPSHRKDILYRKWDSTTALDRHSLVKDSKLGHSLFYGSDSDLMKSCSVLYADESKVYVHDESDGLVQAEEISLDELMAEQLNISELETIKESPEVPFYDGRDSQMNSSESSTLTDIWSDDLEHVLTQAVSTAHETTPEKLTEAYNQLNRQEQKEKRRPLLRRDPWSRYSLDGLLDKEALSDEPYYQVEWNNDSKACAVDWYGKSRDEYETDSSQKRDTDVWIEEFLNQITDSGMPEEPEFYNLEDFNPVPLRKEAEPRIYSNGFHKQLFERSNESRSSSNGREFVRAKTLATIPVEQYLTREEIEQDYDLGPPELPPRGRSNGDNSGGLWMQDDIIGGHYQRNGDGKVNRRYKHQRKKGGSAWTLDDAVASSPSSPVMTRRAPGTPQLYYITPPQSVGGFIKRNNKIQTDAKVPSGLEHKKAIELNAQGNDGVYEQMAGPGGSEGRLDRGSRGGSITRLARRLSQRDKKEPTESPDTRKKTLRQRSVSLDCGDNRRPLGSANMTIKESSSGIVPSNQLSIPNSPSLASKMGQRNSDRRSSSPNLSRRTSSKNQKSSQASERKRRSQDTQALFEAVETQDMDEVKNILETCVVDVNETNNDQLTPLDIAVFMNHVPMARILLSYGARENPKFLRSNESCLIKLISLVKEAEKRITDLKNLVIHNNAGGSSATSTSQFKEIERELVLCEYKLKLFKRMKAGYEHARPPDPPSSVTLSVSSSTSILLQYAEPLHHNGAVVTRYKVVWSYYEDFSPLHGEQILEDPSVMKYEVPDLTQGSAYFVRIQAWNMKGWSDWAIPTPSTVTPTSWREVDGYKCRTGGKFQLLRNLFINMKNSRPSDAAHIKDQNEASPMPARKSNVRKSIKNLFSTAPKFQKSLKRGVYLSSIVCCEDKILVTNDDLLPIIEVDESFSSATLNADFHWLMKIACSWEDVKTLRQDIDKNSTHNAFLFRSKLLQAAAQLQSALGIQDLGMFYHTPVKDINGSVILVTVNTIKDPKLVSTTHVRWASLPKLIKRLATADSIAAPEMLLTATQDMLVYEKASMTALPKGLYAGYLKLTSSVDLIRIMVPEKLPNVLPYCKIRDTPHVIKEEWEWLRNLSMNDIQSEATEIQVAFQNDLQKACRKLLKDVGISEEESVSHRIYDLEVIELSDDVFFILVLPPADSVCNVPGNQEHLSQKPGFTTLPVKLFEMVHMCTYQYELISKYCRLSSILEIDAYLAQQAHREAFSSEELAEAKQRVEQLNTFQQELDDTWKGMRWTMDIITYARDKTVRGGLPLSVLYAPPPSPSESPNMERKSDVSSSVCSDPGYHSDWSSLEQNIEQIGGGSSSSGGDARQHQQHHHHRNHHHDHHHHSHQSSGSSSSGIASSSSSTSSGSSGSSSSSSQQQHTHCTHNDGAGRNHKGDNCACSCDSTKEEVWTPQVEQPPGILRIYAAYDTGLSRGTSVKLHVTARTTSREVVNLVVQQLNKALIGKGLSGPVYENEELEHFCLVVVYGARERVLRDDFQPLLLQNPWTKGKLFVRLKSNLLAALEQGQVTSV